MLTCLHLIAIYRLPCLECADSERRKNHDLDYIRNNCQLHPDCFPNQYRNSASSSGALELKHQGCSSNLGDVLRDLCRDTLDERPKEMQNRGAKVESMDKLPSFEQYFMYPNLSVLSRSQEKYHMTNTLGEHSDSNLYQLNTVNIGCDDAENGPHRLSAKTCCNNVEPHCAEHQSRSNIEHNGLQYVRQESTGFDLQYAMMSEECNLRKRSYYTMVHENSDASNSVLHDTEDLGCNGSSDGTVYQALHTTSDSTTQRRESALCQEINGAFDTQTALQSQKGGAESYELPCSDQDSTYNIDRCYASKLAPKDGISSTSWNKIYEGFVVKGGEAIPRSLCTAGAVPSPHRLDLHKHALSYSPIANEKEKNLSLQAISIQENNSKIQHRGLMNATQLSQIRSSDFETFYRFYEPSLTYESNDRIIVAGSNNETNNFFRGCQKLQKLLSFILTLPYYCSRNTAAEELKFYIKNDNDLEKFIIQEPDKIKTFYLPLTFLKNASNYSNCIVKLQVKFETYEDRLKNEVSYTGRVNIFYDFLLETILDKPDGFQHYTLKHNLWNVQIFMAEFLLYIGWLVKTINNVLMKSTEHKHCIKTEMTHIKNLLEEYYRISALSDVNYNQILKMKEVVCSYRLHILKLLELHCDNSAQCYFYKCALNTTQAYIKNTNNRKSADILYILAFASGKSTFKKFSVKISKQQKAQRTLNASQFVSHFLSRKNDLRLESIRILQSVIEYLRTIKPSKTNEQERLNSLVSLRHYTIMILPEVDCTSTIVRIYTGGEIMYYFHKQIYELFSG